MVYTVSEAIEYLNKYKDLGMGDLKVDIYFPTEVFRNTPPTASSNYICIMDRDCEE